MFKFKSPLTEVDAIDEKIKGYCLAKHPEYFPMILKDLNLLRFWKTLIKDPDVFVIQELAIDRAMNFYEGATCSGLEPAAVKIGGSLQYHDVRHEYKQERQSSTYQ